MAAEASAASSGSSGGGGGLFSLVGGERANRASAKEAERNRAFQMQMSSTAHQREVQDLKAAGLNPILSGVGGSGAATSAGSMAQMIDTFTPAVSTAMEAHLNQEQAKNLREQNALLKDQQENTESDTAKKKAETHMINSAKIGQDWHNEFQNLEQYVRRNKSAVEQTSFARGLSYLDRGTNSAAGVTRLLQNFHPLGKLGRLFRKEKNPYEMKQKPNYQLDVPY